MCHKSILVSIQNRSLTYGYNPMSNIMKKCQNEKVPKFTYKVSILLRRKYKPCTEGALVIMDGLI